jgi:hypothetical protein
VQCKLKIVEKEETKKGGGGIGRKISKDMEDGDLRMKLIKERRGEKSAMRSNKRI